SPEGAAAAMLENLRTFFTDSIRKGKVSKTRETEMMASLNMMGNILGISPQSLQNSPALARKIVVQMLKGVLGMSEELVAVGKGEKPVPEDVQAFVDKVKVEDAAAFGLDPKEIPQEILDHMKATSPEDAVERITGQFASFNDAARTLLQDDAITLDALASGLSQLGGDFEQLFRREDDAMQKIREDVRRDLDEKFEAFKAERNKPS
ncbi:MAG: hypothetical protein AAF570_25705, partial [Bacteroidota bacterium]